MKKLLASVALAGLLLVCFAPSALAAGSGSVKAWGRNNSGQLGDGTTTNIGTPVQSGDLAGVVAVAGGYEHSVALKSDGTVWAWGWNYSGQLGDGTTTNRSAPVQVTDPADPTGYLTGVSAIACGTSHTVALKSDGTVWAWGYNYYGMLGDGTTDSSFTPVQVSDPDDPTGFLTGVKAVACGAYHTVALKSDGTAWAWGLNDVGQLGDGTTTHRYAPVPVTDPADPTGYLTGVSAIACGLYHTVALKSDGTVWAWGYNYYGMLGDGTTTSRYTPIAVSVLTGATAISAGDSHTVALKSDGTAWAWGYNNAGQLGDGTTTDRLTPVQVKGLGGSGYLTGVTAFAVGIYHTAAVKADGTAWAWGNNGNGQLGDGTTTIRTTPVPVSGLSGVMAIACGGYFTVAIVPAADPDLAYGWGANYYGQLGDGTTTDSSFPVQASGLTGLTAVAGGVAHTVALKSDGTVKAWGYNDYGQLGDGTTTRRTTPVDVSGLSGVTAVAGGQLHTVALKSDGTVWAWGWNYYGQLGDGTTTDSSFPVQVPGLTGVIAIACGSMHTVAVKSDGTVWTWGYNPFGQLGNNTTTNSNAPVQVIGLSGATSVACGKHHTLALKSDGTAWAWGYNGFGQIGDGTATQRPTPVQVKGVGGTGYLTGVTAITGGMYHTAAHKSDGTAWAWGYNNRGQLGDGTTTSRYTPIAVSVLTGATAISAGDSHTVALKSDGTAWAWGLNDVGQLGDGTTTDSLTPVQVSRLTGVSGVAVGGLHTAAIAPEIVDSEAPSSSITSPADGAILSMGVYEITGTADDGSGIGVQKVEVSTDGGTTWNLATGTTSWSYSWNISAVGSCSIMSRATDNLENTETPGSGVAVTVDGMDVSFTQEGKTVTLTAACFNEGAPLSGQTIKFYRMKYITTTGTWSSWGSAGTAVADITGTATRTFSTGYGTYRFKAVYAPAGAAAVESDPTSDCVIGPVIALTPATKSVTTDKTPAATWTAFTGVTGYVIQTCATKTFAAGVSENELGPVTSGDLPELARGVKTFWRVIALLPTGRSVPSKPWLVLYKEATYLYGRDANAAGMTIRPYVNLAGVEDGALAGKKVMFYYKSTASIRWLSAGYGITDGGGFAQAPAAKTLPEGSYDLKAVFKGDSQYYMTDETGSFSFGG